MRTLRTVCISFKHQIKHHVSTLLDVGINAVLIVPSTTAIASNLFNPEYLQSVVSELDGEGDGGGFESMSADSPEPENLQRAELTTFLSQLTASDVWPAPIGTTTRVRLRHLYLNKKC